MLIVICRYNLVFDKFSIDKFNIEIFNIEI
jgi:hypothetical protein